MFTKEERSGWKYWFAHFCAYNMTALSLKQWKFKYLFHDAEKPWMRMVMPYEKLQKWHRKHNSHHLEYFLKHKKLDYEAMVIDWECSRFTKDDSPLTARQLYNYYRSMDDKYIAKYGLYDWNIICKNIVDVLDKFGLNT